MTGAWSRWARPLALYRSPANRFVAGFIGSPKMNFLPRPRAGRVRRHAAARLPGDVSVDVAARSPGASEIEVGIRPEHLTPVGPDVPGALRGRVLMSEQLGSDTFLYADIPGLADPLLARVGGETSVTVGETIGLRVEPQLVHAFDSDGAALRHTAAVLRSAA